VYLCEFLTAVVFKSVCHGTDRTGRVAGNLKVLSCIYRVIQKDGLNFVCLYFLNYTWYVNDLRNV